MPVRIIPSDRTADAVRGEYCVSSEKALRKSCAPTRKQRFEILQCSLDDEPGGFPEQLLASDNGFVYTAIKAYNQHHHLVLRPEDVWFAALTQFSLYVNAHSDKLRSKFVAHKGKEELEVEYSRGTRHTVDYGHFVRCIGHLIELNVVDPELRAWMLPDFSTSTRHDTVVAGIILMGALQQYFTYKMTTRCGLPSVTLLGERADWDHLLRDKIPKFAEYGREPAQFASLLKPVVARMVQSFDNPTSSEVINFWQKIVDNKSNGSGKMYYAGWITAFCFWNQDGKCLYDAFQGSIARSLHTVSNPRQSLLDGIRRFKSRRNDGKEEDEGDVRTASIVTSPSISQPGGSLVLDGVAYHKVDSKELPPGWSMMPLKIDDNGVKVKAGIVAGSIGIQCSSSGAADSEDPDECLVDTVQPRTGYWVYEKLSRSKRSSRPSKQSQGQGGNSNNNESEVDDDDGGGGDASSIRSSWSDRFTATGLH